MPEAGYEDYVFTSDEDNQQDEEQDESEDHNETSEEDEDSDDSTDIDIYASFFTDYERYQYDQAQWSGISNPRKYSKASKKGKEGQNKPKPKTQEKSKDLRKAGRTYKRKAEPPLQPTVTIAKEGEIHFDNRDNLWYSYKKHEIYVTERATFHHWIRALLSQDENLKGSYAFPRKRGSGKYDITCFNAIQQDWGLQRPHYAPVMFEWERLDRTDPTYQLGSLHYQGLLVIDYWRTPVRAFQELPLVISSEFEGGYMEPATRLHSEMAYEDIRARMPPFVEIKQKGQTTVKALSKANTFSGRSRHFREAAGAICWDQREGSENIKTFIENIVRPVNNSTRGSRDLTKDEVKRLRLMNCGTKPGRARPGTNKKSTEKYLAGIRKAAGLTPAPPEESIQSNDQADDSMIAEAAGLTPTPPEESIQSNDQADDSMIAQDAPRRFVFRCKEDPSLQPMTEEEALGHPLVDRLDPRNHIPKALSEVEAIQDALQVTIDHFTELFGFEPEINKGGNYISEYCNIQDQMDVFFPDDATALRRLGRWEGTVFDWVLAGVEHEPCIGRRQPFDFSAYLVDM